MDQSIAFRSQEPYTSLKTAFRYRKELVRGCSCKEAEYVAPDAPAEQGKRAATDATTGWEARSEVRAKDNNNKLQRRQNIGGAAAAAYRRWFLQPTDAWIRISQTASSP